MAIKKEVNFVSKVCPMCGGKLEFDEFENTAYCKYCDTQFIVENCKNGFQRFINRVLSFIEKDRHDSREQAKQHGKISLIISAVMLFVLIVICIVCATLE